MPEDEQLSFDAWMSRFVELQREAHGYGITSLVILSQEDPLGGVDTVDYKPMGSTVRVLGMLTHVWRNFPDKR
jgi:hypothetical protein